MHRDSIIRHTDPRFPEPPCVTLSLAVPEYPGESHLSLSACGFLRYAVGERLMLASSSSPELQVR